MELSASIDLDVIFLPIPIIREVKQSAQPLAWSGFNEGLVKEWAQD
jgi:hypothetical protein